MRSIPLLAAGFLMCVAGCSNSPSTPAFDDVVLEVWEIDLVPDSQKDVKVKSGKADKAEGPAAGTGVTAKLTGDKVTVAATKEAKEGVHTVKVHGSKKDVELKVKVVKQEVPKKDAK